MLSFECFTQDPIYTSIRVVIERENWQSSFGIIELGYVESEQEGYIVQSDGARLIKMSRHQKIDSYCFEQSIHLNKV